MVFQIRNTCQKLRMKAFMWMLVVAVGFIVLPATGFDIPGEQTNIIGQAKKTSPVVLAEKLDPLDNGNGCYACCSTGACAGGFKGQPGFCCPNTYNCCPNGTKCIAGGNCQAGAPNPAVSPRLIPGFPSPAPMPSPTLAPSLPASPCVRDTGGTCYVANCYTSRGPTVCEEGRCLCQPGYCSFGGVCVNTCHMHTSTTCYKGWWDCGSGVGSAHCGENNTCACDHGSCNIDGVCKKSCTQKTKSSCYWFNCAGNSTCVNGECVCDSGYCSVSGHCKSIAEATTPNVFVDMAQQNFKTAISENSPVKVWFVAFGVAFGGALATGAICVRRRINSMEQPLLESEGN